MPLTMVAVPNARLASVKTGPDRPPKARSVAASRTARSRRPRAIPRDKAPPQAANDPADPAGQGLGAGAGPGLGAYATGAGIAAIGVAGIIANAKSRPASP